jgi:GNAT superfamily N-acetyltransferase
LHSMGDKRHHIRDAYSSDVPVLSGLIRDSFRDVAERFGLTPENCPKHPSNCTIEWIDRDLARGVIYYILEYNGVPTGCAALEIAGSDLCYLERLVVLPQNRRSGFGRTLVDHVCSNAQALGAKQIGIGIISDHTELKTWYRKIGFIEGETKVFAHLPFRVTFLTYNL